MGCIFSKQEKLNKCECNDNCNCTDCHNPECKCNFKKCQQCNQTVMSKKEFIEYYGHCKKCNPREPIVLK